MLFVSQRKMSQYNKEQIASFLKEALGEKKAKDIPTRKYFNYDKLCNLLPIVCGGEEGPNDSFKLSVLESDPRIFFELGDIVDGIPDQRILTEESKRTFNVEKWNPWLALSENLANYGEVRKHKYDSCKRNLTIDAPRLNYQKFRYEKIIGSNQNRKMMKDFFLTYPTLSYLLLMRQNDKGWAIFGDHHLVTSLPKDGIQDGYAVFARRREVVDWILNGKDANTLFNQSRNWMYNKHFVSWLLDNGISEEKLYADIAILDNVMLFRKVYKVHLLDAWLSLLFKERSGKILDYLILEGHNIPIDALYKALTDYPWNMSISMTVRKNYGATRFYGPLDLLEKAIDGGDIRWIKALVEKGEDIVSPIKVNGYCVISPLLFAMEKSGGKDKTLIEYMLTLYDIEPEDLLYMAVNHRLYGTIEYMKHHMSSLDKQVYRNALAMVGYPIKTAENRKIIEILLDKAKLELTSDGYVPAIIPAKK